MRYDKAVMSIVLAATLLATACGAQSIESPEPEATTDARQEPKAVTGAAAHQSAVVLTGTVLETIDADPYTYVKLDTGDDQVWAAAPRCEVAIGEEVAVSTAMPMYNFHSTTLDRDFELVYFVSGLSTDQQPAMPPGHPTVTTGDQPKVDLSDIGATAGGITIGDLYAKKAELAGKQVTIRAKVVKINLGIMGRNWLHIQDGTGDAEAGTNDLTVTSNDRANVGDIVTVTGKLTIDKDFGAGYRYQVIVEEAKVAVSEEL
jgi:hypothetical protein